MAKSKSKVKPDDMSPKILNRRARFDYAISDTLECGIQLVGSEVKAIRHGKVSLAEGFATVEPTMELLLRNVDVGQYSHAGPAGHEGKRPRKLLAHKAQIRKLQGATSAKGVTLIPLAMYFKHGKVKVEIGLATGKRQSDKRQDIKKREDERDMRRAMTRREL